MVVPPKRPPLDHRIRWTPLAIFTGLLALATFVVAGLSYCQMRDSKQAFITGQRAFVYVERPLQPTAFLTKENRDKVFGLNLVVVNSGATPTKDAKFVVRCVTSPQARLEPWVLLNKESLPIFPLSIGPKATVTAGRCTFTGQEFLQMRDLKMFGYFMGEITYKDRLDESVNHVTQFDFGFSDINLDDAITNLAALAIGLVGKHNCADEECPEH